MFYLSISYNAYYRHLRSIVFTLQKRHCYKNYKFVHTTL